MNFTYHVLAILNILVATWRCFNKWTSQSQPAARLSEAGKYSYRGTDYPFELPFDISDSPVAMTLHETVHYSLNWTDPVAQSEWINLVTSAKENGRTRLGPDHRLFTLVFWHGFHCLWSIETAFNEHNNSYAGFDHLHHCLNYLRQMMLCQAVDTLELGDFMARDLENDRIGDTVVCRDWQQVYAAMEENYQNWSEWAGEWN